MKRTSLNRSAFFNPRVLIACTLAVIGCVLALGATGVFRLPDASEVTHPGKWAAVLLKKKMPARGSASRTVRGAAAPTKSAPLSAAILSIPNVKAQKNQAGQTVYSISASNFDISPPLSELAKLKIAAPSEVQLPELELPASRILRSSKTDPVVQVAPASKASKSRVAPKAATAAPTTGFSFEGVSGTGSFPPDTNGSVGNNQYVETVNTRYQVWSLNRTTNTATSILGPVNINTLWAGFGGGCQSQNAGDPVVLYDKVANRWLISQFTSSAVGGVYYQCVAVSTTANATGTYARYAFAVPNGNFGDYPKYGVWSDAYYVMAHNFSSSNPSTATYVGGCFGAMNRTKMIAGDPSATWQVIVDPFEGGHMPADLDGFAPPPGGAPGIFTSVHTDGMYLYRMKVDFANPANTNRTLQAILPIAPASAACGGGNCIPQPQSNFTIDSLADRLMFRLAYRNLIDHESLVVSHSVDPNVDGVVSGVRWYEFRISGQADASCPSYPCTYQQGTVADVENGRSRWMPSVAMDAGENILVGYSATGTISGVDNHSIRYTARAKADPLGTMTAREAIIFTGTMNIINDPAGLEPGRWGDYTSTSVDPADDCTFWHANEYYALGGVDNGSWHTRIASATFPAAQCAPSTCTNRPTAAPAIGSAAAIAPNHIQITWTAVSPAPGSYAIERAIFGSSQNLYQPVGFVAGSATNFVDATVEGGVTYTYRVIAASDNAGRCQALVRSGTATATATGNCTIKPSFGGLASATGNGTATCGITLNWSPASSNCPLNSSITYNIYRGTVPDFVPAAPNRIASCITATSYVDSDNVTSGTTYYYVVRAEDSTSGNGGACGGNEETNTFRLSATTYGDGVSSNVGTWTDGGGDSTGFLQLNTTDPGNTSDPTWRIVRTADDPDANHTPSGAYAYRNAGPGPNAIYGANLCSAAETPVLTVGSSTINLTYWERHQMEKGWDGVAIEYSRNGGPWTDVPAPSNSTGDGCLVSDITADYAALDCTGDPPLDACDYPASKAVITGPAAIGGVNCDTWTTDTITSYGRRCHLLTGLTPGDTIQFRWRFTSDPGSEFNGFYLDDIGITNIRLPNSCTTVLPAPALVGAASRLTHGSVGPFDAFMPLDGSGIEPRNGNGNHTIILHFDRPIQSGTAAVTAGAGSAGTVSFSGNDMIVNLSGVGNAQRITLTATNVAAATGGVLNSVALNIGFLIGDTNADKFVDAVDVAQTKSQSGNGLTNSNFREDVNADGFIDAVDVAQVKSKSGTVVP